VNAFLENPPKIWYENVPFSNLPKDKVIGLVTIKNLNQSFLFQKKHSLPIKFIRIGSNSIPLETEIETNYQNTSKL
jgi:hypothetical protein